ncbi:caspase-1-like [Poecilia formosa]|uniref:caspase-1-like n=1 Tax=Poecilia formosa TaxID=48698 RepID=UPI00044397BC|nr:PREDICTED: caspase-1-like [Poecilia formosa]
MMQKYGPRGAVSVMAILFKKLNRNDLVNKLRRLNPQAADEGLVPAASPNSSVDWVQMLTNVRAQLATTISPPILQQILDRMLENNILNDGEMDLGQKPQGDKVREVVDMVQKKGPKASWAFITALCELDRCLVENLNLLIK